MFDQQKVPFQHRGFGRVTWGVGAAVLALFGIALLTSARRGWERPAPNPVLARQAASLDRKISADQLAQTPPPMAVSATDLWRAYHRDQPAAERRFRGKQLMVTGAIKSLKREQRYDVVIKLRGPVAASTVHATLPSWEGPRAAKLKRGDKVTMLCTGGERILQSPTLRGCILQ